MPEDIIAAFVRGSIDGRFPRRFTRALTILQNTGGRMILITGATGRIGSATVQQLAASGLCVRALVRSLEKAASIAGPGVEVVRGDLEQTPSFEAALQGVTRALL